MTNRRLVMFLFVLVLGAVAAYAVFYPTDAAGEEPIIRYPEAVGEEFDPMVDIAASNRLLLEEITIGPDNARQILAMLNRPQEYTATYEITYHLDGGEARRLSVQLWVTAEMQKVLQGSDALEDQKHTILTKENIYIWDADESGVYVGKVGNFTVDDIGHILTHENVLALDQDGIWAAQVTPVKEGEDPCLVLETINPLSGYLEVYSILADTGLLISCFVYDGERCVYEMTQISLSLEPIHAEEVFLLPSGNMPT